MKEQRELVQFLLEAKLQTYANAEREPVAPLIPGAKQLEYQRGDWAYRDIYFGNGFFAGQEMVLKGGKPVWSMVYSGGMTHPRALPERVEETYAFLIKALGQANEDTIFRGPEFLREGELVYLNEWFGELESFSGMENIQKDGETIYGLHYSGGCIK